jgi:hypothetical protein
MCDCTSTIRCGVYGELTGVPYAPSPRKVCSTHVRMSGFGRAARVKEYVLRYFSRAFQRDKQSGLVG